MKHIQRQPCSIKKDAVTICAAINEIGNAKKLE